MCNEKEIKLHSFDSLATGNEWSYDESNFESRLDRYSRAKSLALEQYQYMKNSLPQSNLVRKKSVSLRECGSYLVFRDYFLKHEIKLVQASFCNAHLLCPLCAIRRGAKLLSRYLDRYTSLMSLKPHSVAYMVTLTVKDGDVLKERFNHLKSAVSRYYKGRHRAHTSCEAKKAHSGVWSYEIKRGKNSGSWHPHVHGIWLCEEKPDAFKLSEEWKHITGDSFIVDVRPIDKIDPVSGFLEVFKYALKFSEQSPEDTYHCFTNLSRARLIGSFGDFRNVPPVDDLTDELYEEEPYLDLFFSYVGNQYSRFEKEDFAA